jgi:uncharacterized repeat protein (TIGR03843 family)
VPADELTPLGVEPLTLLREGEIEVEGRMPWSSNATFLVTVSSGAHRSRAVYKPLRGERPLWDFPPGLHRREVAAYRLSEAMGLHVVPPTVLRDGPLGEGSLQWFVDAVFEEHYFTMYEQRPELHDQLRAIAVLDLVANNTDRKGGHCLVDRAGKVWAIDNGLCFSSDFKLRTVIWEFGGEPIPDELLTGVREVAEQPPLAVATLLDDDEVAAMQERARWVLEHPVFPIDTTGRRYPWPMV